jgi:hypothetical protein
MATAATEKPVITPGPWYLTQSEWDSPRYVREVNTDAVLAMIEDGGHVDPSFALPFEEQVGNAHLMVAAPDLYEALEFVRDTLAMYVRPDVPAMKIAEAALAKARGK